MTIVLVGLFIVQDPHPGRQLRWHIDHSLAGGEQLLSQQRASAGRALDRPQPWCEPDGPVQQPLPLAAIRWQLEHRPNRLCAVDHYRCM